MSAFLSIFYNLLIAKIHEVIRNRPAVSDFYAKLTLRPGKGMPEKAVPQV